MGLRPPSSEQVVIAGPAGPLECLLVEHPQSTAVGIVCHPHPVFGGTMHNKVVHTVARAFFELGLTTVRFNFRGVGESMGAYAEGAGETEDCIAVVDWAEQMGNGAIWLGGFSFGAYVALRTAQARMPRRLVSVAPPVQRFEFGRLQIPTCPWLIVQGDEDELVDCDAVVEWVNRLPPGPELAVMNGVDHFFHGRLTELRELLVDALIPENT